MTRADRYMDHDIRHILQDGYKDKNPRPHCGRGFLSWENQLISYRGLFIMKQVIEIGD